MISCVFGGDAARDSKLAKDIDPSRFSLWYLASSS
jgi:hypothetical protein